MRVSFHAYQNKNHVLIMPMFLIKKINENVNIPMLMNYLVKW